MTAGDLTQLRTVGGHFLIGCALPRCFADRRYSAMCIGRSKVFSVNLYCYFRLSPKSLLWSLCAFSKCISSLGSRSSAYLRTSGVCAISS